ILGAQPEADVDAGCDSGDGASDDDGDPGGFLASDWVGCGGVGGLEFRQGAGFAGGWGRLGLGIRLKCDFGLFGFAGFEGGEVLEGLLPLCGGVESSGAWMG